MKAVVEERRHPRQQHDSHEVRAHECAHEAQQRRRARGEAKEGRQRKRGRRRGGPPQCYGHARRSLGEGGRVHRAARRLRQKSPQHHREHDAETTEDNERQTPTVVLADPSREEAAGDRPDVHARLMQAHRARPCVAAVIVADERHRRRVIERFAQPFRRAEQEQVPEVSRERGRDANPAPRVQSAEDRRPPLDAIDNHSRERRREAVDPGKCRSEQTELHGREPQLTLEQRKDGEDGLPVRVVADADRPEHQDDPPFVSRVRGHGVDAEPIVAACVPDTRHAPAPASRAPIRARPDRSNPRARGRTLRSDRATRERTARPPPSGSPRRRR